MTFVVFPGSQGEHALAAPSEYVPTGHATKTLDPSQWWPGGHSLQAVRAVLVPPEVNEPGGHTEQLGALFTLHRLSAPQSTQPSLSERDVPARHGTHDDAPASE